MKVIDHAYRECRMPPQSLGAEMIDVAKDKLYLLLSSLANKGAPLWCQTRDILPLYQGNPVIPCDVGAVDVLNANIRTLQRASGVYTFSSGNDADYAFDGDLSTATTNSGVAGYIKGVFVDGVQPTSFGILPGATGTWDIAIQYSDDDITYTTAYANTTLAAVDSEWFWVDVASLPSAVYWKIQAGAATTLSVREFVIGYNPTEIPIARLNKDDYFYLPNKTLQGSPVQYWLDRQYNVINLNIWPAPDSSSTFKQLIVLTHRHIMDVGTLGQSLEIPQRWYRAVVLGLAADLIRVTPEANADLLPSIRADAKEALAEAWAEERDKSPTMLSPNISMYTR
jgi:hypothetical protein